MSLRATVFLAVFLVVACTTAMEATLDIVIDRFEDHRLFLDLLDVPLTLVIAGVGAWLLARRIARPLNELTRATHAVATLLESPTLTTAGKDELARLVTGFNEMAAAVEASIERERAFTRYASHELRTPLSAMRLQLERAQLGHTSAEEVLPALERGVAQLEEILEALLSLARDSASGDPRPVGAVLTEVIETLPATDRGRVTVRGEACAATVRHPRLFQQAATNLVDNALRHGSGGTTVNLTADGRSVTLRVDDDGPGLAPPALELATRPFYRGSSEDGGHGLGLSFVAFLAKALEGELHLTNSGTGLTAELSLPIVADRATP